MGCSDTKQGLYERAEAAIGKIASRQMLGYVCPICLRSFKDLRELTEEHVPPKSIGGKVLCLTCRECNCTAGYSVDTQLQRERLSQGFLGKDGQIRRAKLIVHDLEINVHVKRDEKGNEIKILGSDNNPKDIEKLPEKIQSNKGFNLRDTVSYSRRTADIGYLKTAYLAAFAKFGYSYILRLALNRVREQIKDPSSRVLETVRVYCDGISISKKVFLLFHEPIRCLGIKVENSIVCLPLPDGDDIFYKTLAEMRASGRIFTWRSNATIKWPKRFELPLDFAE